MDELPGWWETEFDDYCLEVGRLTAMWAAFERSLDSLIWEMLDVYAFHGMCLTAQMIGPGPRVKALCALLDAMDASADLQTDFKRFATRSELLGGKRNRYVHDNVSIGTSTRIVRRIEITANKRLRYEKDVVEIGSVRSLWIEVRNAIAERHDLRKRWVEEFPEWKRARYNASLAP